MQKVTVTAPAGSEVQFVELKGNPENPEPTHFRTKLPFGEVDIVRTMDNNYWVHVVNKKTDSNGLEYQVGNIEKFRIDGNNQASIHHGKIDGYHMAVLLSKKD